MLSKKARTIYLAAALLLFAISSFYAGKEHLSARFKKSLEMLLSDEIGAEIKIGSIGGNILKRGLLRDVNCEFGKFNIALIAPGLIIP